jgi:hypothetical protein
VKSQRLGTKRGAAIAAGAAHLAINASSEVTPMTNIFAWKNWAMSVALVVASLCASATRADEVARLEDQFRTEFGRYSKLVGKLEEQRRDAETEKRRAERAVNNAVGTNQKNAARSKLNKAQLAVDGFKDQLKEATQNWQRFRGDIQGQIADAKQNQRIKELQAQVNKPSVIPSLPGPIVQNPEIRVTIRVDINNPTDQPLNYTFNGENHTIEPGSVVNWAVDGTAKNPPVLSIAFDNGSNRVIRYRLADGSVNDFVWTSEGLDLRRRQ